MEGQGWLLNGSAGPKGGGTRAVVGAWQAAGPAAVAGQGGPTCAMQRVRLWNLQKQSTRHTMSERICLHKRMAPHGPTSLPCSDGIC